ncbi:MAG: hypothetical protein ACI81R_002557 [Bradymonadia bacterium]
MLGCWLLLYGKRRHSYQEHNSGADYPLRYRRAYPIAQETFVNIHPHRQANRVNGRRSRSATGSSLLTSTICLALLLGCGTSPGSSDEVNTADTSAPLPDAGADALPSIDASQDIFADAEADTEADTEADSGRDTTVPDAFNETLAMGCEGPEVAWSVEEQNWWLDVGYVGLTPEHGVLLRGQMIQESLPLRGAVDGELLGTRMHDEVIDLSADGTIEATRSPEGITIRDRSSGRALSTMASIDSSSGLKRFELSPSGERFGMLSCLFDTEGVELEIRSADGDSLHRWILPEVSEFGCIGWADHNAYAMDVHDDWAVVANPTSGSVWVYSLASGDARELVAHEDLQQEEWERHLSVVDIQIHPSGREFATAGRDGWVYRWDTETLAAIGEGHETSLVALNTQTFTTGFFASPVSYSPNGAAFAFVNDEGSVVVIDLRTDEVLATTPSTSVRQDDRPVTVNNTGVAFMGFSTDSRSLVIIENGATQLLTCGLEFSTTQAPTLQVDAPARGPAGTAFRVTITTSTATGYAGLSVVLDGEPSYWQAGSTEQDFFLTTPGEHEILFTLSDGQQSVEQRVTIVSE